MSRLTDEHLRELNDEEQYNLGAYAKAFSHMEQTYPGLMRGVEFHRHPAGMLFNVFDKTISMEKPTYRLATLNREWGMIASLVPGGGMFFPCYSLDDYNVLLTFGMQPPGMILASGESKPEGASR